MSTPCGSHYYRIFSAFGSFPAVTWQANYAFPSHDLKKIKRVFDNYSAGSLIDGFVGLSANWFGKHIGGIFLPNSLVKALGTDACCNRAWANQHLTIHRMWKPMKKTGSGKTDEYGKDSRRAKHANHDWSGSGKYFSSHLNTTPARTRVKQTKFLSFLGNLMPNLPFFLGGETELAPLNLNNQIR